MSAALLSSPHIHSGLLDIQELRNFPLFLAQRAEVLEGVRHKPLEINDRKERMRVILSYLRPQIVREK